MISFINYNIKMSNMKEINDAKIHKKNMREKTAIATEIKYKKKSHDNSTISRIVRTEDKINANPNLKALHEITAKERSPLVNIFLYYNIFIFK